MKFIWEVEDIKGGRHVKKKGTNEIWMIGYIVCTDKNLYSIVSLTDGAILEQHSKEGLIKLFNNNEYVPISL